MIDKEICVSLKYDLNDEITKFVLCENGEMRIEMHNLHAVVKIDDALKATAWLKKMGEVITP